MSNLLQHGGHVAGQSNMIMYLDSKNLRSYEGEPTTNLISESGIDFSVLSSTSADLLRYERVSDSSSPSGYALEMQITSASVSTSSRVRVGEETNIPASGSCFISIYVKQIVGTTTIVPRVYTGENWYALGSLDGGSQYVTNKYRRFGAYVPMGVNSGGPNPGFSITHNEDTTVNDIFRFHSPQVEIKDHATSYTATERLPTWSDLSKNSNHADLTNMTFNEDGMIFDGLSGYMSVTGPVAAISPVTISCWAKTEPSGFGAILNQYEHSGFGWGLRTTDGTNIYIYDDSTSTDSPIIVTNIQTGQWYHFAVTHDGTNFTLYINGESVGTASQGSTANGTGNFYIGQRGSDVWFFKGEIDLVSVYNIALTSEQVMNNYLCHRSRFS